MFPASAAFTAAVAGSHQMVVTATIDNPSGNDLDLSDVLIGGSVEMDARRQQRGSCTLELIDPDGEWMPTDKDHPLNPAAGRILRVGRGVRYTDGTDDEVVPLGAFRITGTKADESADGIKLTVEGVDFSWIITRAQWVRPWGIASGTTVETAIWHILEDRYPGIIAWDFPPTTHTLPPLVYGLGSDDETDPWSAAQELATNSGFDLYFDRNGVVQMAQTPDPNGTAVATYGPGETEVVVSAARDWNGDDLFNGVVITAENANLVNPLRGEAWDDDENSTTYRYGPYGEIPLIETSSTSLTQRAVQAAADERLRRVLGIGAGLEWTQVVNPALEPGDIIRHTRDALGVDQVNFVIDQIVYPLTAGEPMSAIGRSI